MIYALCFATNTLHCFHSEREASEYCQRHPGDWQLCDAQGRVCYPIGMAPRLHLGLLAAHLWLEQAYLTDGVPETGVLSAALSPGGVLS